MTDTSHSQEKWIVDSGATSHMTYQKHLLHDYREFDKPEKVGLGDGRVVDAVGTGSVCLTMRFKVSDPKRARMHKVLYVPKLACNLFSVRAAAQQGNLVKFGSLKCWIRKRNGGLLGMGLLDGSLYCLDSELILPTPTTEQASAACEQSSDLWHQRLGHVNAQYLQNLSQKEMVTGMKLPKEAQLSFCEGCVEGKMHRQPFKSVGESHHSSRKLQLVHSDVCRPMDKFIGGKHYFVSFIDDYSRCCAIYFMNSKAEVFEKFREFEAIITNESGQQIGTLRTDNGGEYLSKEFEAYLSSKGIKHELTIAYSPEQNGVAERMNRTLMESARAMMSHANLPNQYWAEAVATAVYLSESSALKEDMTPFEKWYGMKPDISHLRVFGCIAYSHIPILQRRKLDKKARKYRFVGYCKNSKGYRLFDEETQKVVKRRDVIFNERNFDLNSTTDPDQQATLDLDSDSEVEQNSAHEVEGARPQYVRQSSRTRKPPVRFGLDEYADMATIEHVACVAGQVLEPHTIEEALSGDDADKWKTATDSEYNSLLENETWDLVELPHDRQAIPCKWVFKVKYKEDGSIERYKAHLVAKGYAQKHGIDYDETSSVSRQYEFFCHLPCNTTCTYTRWMS